MTHTRELTSEWTPRPRTIGLRARLLLRAIWWCGRLGLSTWLTRMWLQIRDRLGPIGQPAALAAYTPTAGDVFVCTYSKSGTNWMMQIVSQIAYLGQGDFRHIHDVVPWPEAPFQGLVSSLDDPVQSVTGHRAIKTHLPASQVPATAAALYVVVVRDPKDVYVSSYHFIGGMIAGLWGGRLERQDWYERFVTERSPLGSWVEHTASWWARRHEPNVLLVTYAELKESLPDVVRQIASRMGVPLSDEALAAVVERSTFTWMKAHERVFRTPIPTMSGVPAEMIRTGRVGDGRALLSVEEQRRLDDTMQRGLAARGSTFPYSTAFAARTEHDKTADA